MFAETNPRYRNSNLKVIHRRKYGSAILSSVPYTPVLLMEPQPAGVRRKAQVSEACGTDNTRATHAATRLRVYQQVW
jgi:hypothetical protein